MSFSDSAGPAPAGPGRVRRRGPIIPTLIVLFILASVGGAVVNTWTEGLWFQQTGYFEVFQLRLVAQIALFVAAGVLMAIAVFGNMFLAYRNRPLYAPMGLDDSSLERYREALAPVRRVIAIVLPAGLALFAGTAASSEWMTFVKWWHRTPFAQGNGTGVDPEFNLDIGFYVFTLPALRFVLGFGFAMVLLSLLVALAVHYVYGGVRVSGQGPKTTKTARIQLSVLLALLMLFRAGGYWLDRYSLMITSASESRFPGAGYTDIMAVLPARSILAGISIVVAGLFIAAAITSGWRLPVVGVALMTISAILVGGLYPAAVQRFQVKPSEKTLEQKYIQRSIEATKQAYGLTEVEQKEYQPKADPSAGGLSQDAQTTASIRLLDPAVVSPAFKQIERNKQYYSFPDILDVDRYTINGESKDTVVAVRELDVAGLPSDQRNWINLHTVYTHGFGVVAAYGNQRTAGGAPAFFQQGIPSTGELGDYEPRIYFGEKSPEYSIVGGPEGTEPRELDYPSDESKQGQVNNTFQGDGGPKVGTFLNKLLFAVKFRDQNIVLSDALNKESQILYDRTPRERVKKVAPWLTLDGDPYPAVVGNRVKWIVDGYTTTDAYPYSDVQTLDAVTTDQNSAASSSVVPLPPKKVNYIRNSVKATVDAYDGKVELYAWEENDPLLKTWQKVFPQAIKPMSDISADLMQHLRYPEDLFKVQRSIWAQYHVADPDSFFSGQDFWQIPREPTASNDKVRNAQPPYYLTLKMPGQETSSFSLTTSFIPKSSAGNEASVLTGFMAVDADAGTEAGKRADSFGKFRVLQLPRNLTVNGPGQAQNEFNSDPVAAQQITLLEKTGSSSVIRGNLLTLPVGDGLLYVQPVYVKSAAETSYPLLRKVLVLFGNEVGFADTLDEALNMVFDGDSGAQAGDAGTPEEGDKPDQNNQPDQGQGDGEATPTPTPTPTTQPTSDGTPQQDLNAALAEAKQAFKEGQDALKANDFAAYGKAQQKLQAAIEKAVVAQDKLKNAPAVTPTSTPTPTD